MPRGLSIAQQIGLRQLDCRVCALWEHEWRARRNLPPPLLPIVHVQEVVCAAEEGRRRCKGDADDDYDNDDGVDDVGGGGDNNAGLSF